MEECALGLGGASIRVHGRSWVAFRDIMSLYIRRSRNSPGMRREGIGASFRAADSAGGIDIFRAIASNAIMAAALLVQP